jgi:hypothetical protein
MRQELEMRRARLPIMGAVLLAALVAVGANCSTSSGAPPNDNPQPQQDASQDTSMPMTTPQIQGYVTDETGKLLSGVTVTLGTTTVTTNSHGSYVLAIAPTNGLIVTFSATGYLPSSKAVVAPAAGASAYVTAALMTMATPQPLDATNGGMISGTRGSQLKVPAAALVDQNGKAVTGMVQVSLTPLDPSVSGELAAYPGALVGSMGSGSPSLLQTYGVLDVTATQNGQPVQVASGKTVNVTIPVAASGAGTLPQTEDLWSFNPTTAVWDHEGTATLSGSVYTAQLAHFSYHNIDKSIVSGMATCVTGLVVDSSGNPVAGANVSPSEGASTESVVATDSTGRYCVWLTTGSSDTIIGNATASPYGQGSITVTGGASMPFPGSYTCSNLNCTMAPNIVIDQAPCTGASGCTGGAECCAVNGQNQCLQDFACFIAQSGGTGPGGIVTPPPTGDAGTNGSCKIPGSSGTVTVVLNGGADSGQTWTLNCFTVEYADESGMGVLTLAGTGPVKDQGIEFELASNDDFAGVASGQSYDLAADAGAALGGFVQVEGMPANSGTVTFTQWSTTSGAQVSFTFTNVTLEGVVDGGFATLGTVSGTATANLAVLP